MKHFFKLFTLFFTISLFAFSSCSDNEDSLMTAGKDSVKELSDADIKACFDAVNNFRTESEAFYINEDNTTKTSLVGKLSTLTFDEKLTKAAKIRAEELAKSFSHTRPNGSSWSTALKEVGATYGTSGENIAAGYKTGNDVFIGWKEDNKNYSGQGHRRNMLGKNFTKIGIAYFDKAGSTYGRYWVMELSN